MHNLIAEVEKKYKKPKVVDVQSGDTVRVHQKIKEGNKERTQVFEGLVIKTRNKNTVASAITVRRIASGVGVEKTYKLHSPLVEKVEVVKRSKVRRKYLSYMRQRSGKSARLSSVDFNKTDVNDVSVPMDETKEAKQAMEHLAEEEKPETKPAEQAEDKPTDEKPEESAKEESKEAEKAEEKKEETEASKPEEATDTQTKEDKAAAKKAKAEEFRKQQESK